MKTKFTILLFYPFLLVGCNRNPTGVEQLKRVEIEYLAKEENDLLDPFSNQSQIKAKVVTAALNDMASQGWELIQVDRKYNELKPFYLGRDNEMTQLHIKGSNMYLFRRTK